MTAQDATAHDWPPSNPCSRRRRPALLAAVARAAVSMAAPAGAVLFSQGDAADAFLIIALRRGAVQVIDRAALEMLAHSADA